MKLQHIAYYNDNIDLIFFSEQTADAIVDCAKRGYGGLHSIDSFDATTHTQKMSLRRVFLNLQVMVNML